MFYFSKSKFCQCWQCPKMLWLHKNKPEEYEIGEDVQERMRIGNEVGDLAMGIFGDFVEVTAKKEDGSLDLTEMIRRTEEEMQKGAKVICEASFCHEGKYCAVDILLRGKKGWIICEVKSGTHYDKDVYYMDVAYQMYILEQCGVPVQDCCLICLNRSYRFSGTLKLNELFYATRITDAAEHLQPKVPQILAEADWVLSQTSEPDIPLSVGCRAPYPCGFWNYCARNLPSPSVFDLYQMNFDEMLRYYDAKLTDFPSLLSSKKITDAKQLRQMEHAVHPQPDYVDKKQIRAFLEELKYPLYFLDFETIQPAVPRYVGTSPYDQIPFQYSLHIAQAHGDLEHREFLAEAKKGQDPRRALAEQLCRDIPENACTVAYNKAFECTMLEKMAAIFPDLAEHLRSIAKNMKDLLVPFRKGYYYSRAMGGSFSIKRVLPALFPNDPSLNYENLRGVHNGAQAMSVFPKMEDMEADELAAAREDLLRYCELDTYAMVKIWEKLKDVCK